MDMNSLLKQAQTLQKKMEKMTADLAQKEYYAESGNGLVKLCLLGDYRLKNIEISPEILHGDDKEMIEDLIKIAYQNAKEQLEKESRSQMSGMGLPF